MQKTIIENISGIKLDFFLRQNNEDVRVVLNSGESSWCDHESTTKSMILYERKKLIKISDNSPSKEESKAVEDVTTPNEQNSSITLNLVPNQPLVEPDKPFFISMVCDQTLIPKEIEKKYKGKKRGRKKKRGPKPGSKRNKGNNSENQSL